jgi:hypothetical protein
MSLHMGKKFKKSDSQLGLFLDRSLSVHSHQKFPLFPIFSQRGPITGGWEKEDVSLEIL